jgi:hypothetical protein
LVASTFGFWIWQLVVICNVLTGGLVVIGHSTLHVASHWKATIHIFRLKKFQKIQKFIAFIAARPKTKNTILAPLVF